MKNLLILVFLLLGSISSWSQAYKDNSNCYTVIPYYNLYTSFEQLKDVNKERSLQIFTGGFGIETSIYKLGGGLGFFKDIEYFGKYPIIMSSYGIISTTTFDSIYYVNDIAYHYYRRIDKYDSIIERSEAWNYATYNYGLALLKYNLNIFTWKHITLSASTEIKFIFETKRTIPNLSIEGLKIVNFPRLNEFYVMENLGLNIFYRFRPHKSLLLPSRYKTANKFTVFISYSYSMQFHSFQPDYSNRYTSYAFGLLYSL